LRALAKLKARWQANARRSVFQAALKDWGEYLQQMFCRLAICATTLLHLYSTIFTKYQKGSLKARFARLASQKLANSLSGCLQRIMLRAD